MVMDSSLTIGYFQSTPSTFSHFAYLIFKKTISCQAV